MRHYHGTPLGGTRESVARFVSRGNRNFLVPFGRDEDLPAVSEYASGFILDNGAFTAWRQGKPVTNWQPYYKWCKEWHRHPRFDFAIIPDVIDGSEEENHLLFAKWFQGAKVDGGRGWVDGAPVWHMHESLCYLKRLADHSRVVCIGSSGEFSQPGTTAWHDRMAKAMGVLCDDRGRPRRKIHGLRMLNPEIVRRYPLYSADSTNVAQNSQLLGRFGIYKPPTQCQRREVIAARIESVNSPSHWVACDEQLELTLS